jgi:hypothetical protein
VYQRAQTIRRAHIEDNRLIHDLPADNHVNPVDRSGSLVVHEWGRDLPGLVSEWSGLPTEIVAVQSQPLGIEGEFTEVIVSRKAL